jgi:hypothetical protein
MTDITWFGGGLVQSPIRYCICTSEEQFIKEMERLEVKERVPWIANDRSHGSTHFYVNEDEGELAIVCISPDPKRSYNEIVTLIVHESVHIFQAICENWGEKKPSKEFEAYSIQTISLDLIHEFCALERYEPPTRKPRPKPRAKRSIPAPVETSRVDTAGAPA